MTIFVVLPAATTTVLDPYPRLNSGHFLVQLRQNQRSTSELQSPKPSPAVDGFFCHATILSSRIPHLNYVGKFFTMIFTCCNVAIQYRHKTMVTNFIQQKCVLNMKQAPCNENSQQNSFIFINKCQTSLRVPYLQHVHMCKSTQVRVVLSQRGVSIHGYLNKGHTVGHA